MLLRSLACWILLATTLLMFLRAVLSWVRFNYDSPGLIVVAFVNRITDPLLRPFRAVIPTLRIGNAGIDLSVMALLIVVIALRRVIC